MNYKAEFSQSEKNIFNTVERDNMRLSAMSVYGVMINSFECGDVCTLSYKQIIFRTKRKYKMVLSMLKRRIELLEKLGLIKIIRNQLSVSKQKYSYKVIRKSDSFEPVENGKENHNENEKKNGADRLESVEDISFIDYESIQKPKQKEILYNTYIKDLSIAKEITVKLFKELKIKKDIIKNSVLKRVSEIYKTINEKGAEKYISTIILNTVMYFEVLSRKYNAKLVINKRVGKRKFSSFEGRTRTKEEYEELYDDPALGFC